MEEIKEDGTVVLTTEAYDTGEELYSLGLREYRFADLEDIAKELVARVKRLSAKAGLCPQPRKKDTITLLRQGFGGQAG